MSDPGTEASGDTAAYPRALAQQSRSDRSAGLPVTHPFASKPDTAPAYWFLNSLWIILVDGNDTGGRFSLIEQHMPHGSSPIPHVHHYSDEWFYLLDGSFDAVVGGDHVTANKGDTVWIPRGTVHSFTVTSENCHVLNGYEPAGVEQVIKGLGKPAERRELPPPGPMPSERELTLMFNHYWASEATHLWANGV